MKKHSNYTQQHKPYVWGYPRIWFVLSYKILFFSLAAFVFWIPTFLWMSDGQSWESNRVMFSMLIGSGFTVLEIYAIIALHQNALSRKDLIEHRRFTCPLCNYSLYNENDHGLKATCPECGCTTCFGDVYFAWKKVFGKRFMKKHGFRHK